MDKGKRKANDIVDKKLDELYCELLEQFIPQFGHKKAVQMVTEMINDQTIQWAKFNSFVPELNDEETVESNNTIPGSSKYTEERSFKSSKTTLTNQQEGPEQLVYLYEYLLEIFPDADPTYLKDFVDTNNVTEQSLQQFIHDNLKTRNYPRKEQYLSKIKISQQLEEYTTGFSVKKFLERLPDPFRHFENENRKCTYDETAILLLRTLFRQNKVTTISAQYRLNKCNMSLTAKALTALGPDMKTRRSMHTMKPILNISEKNIHLFQEHCFIDNRKKILDHLSIISAQEEQLFKEYQENNLLSTCQCCYNDECMPNKCAECDGGHIFCFECIIRGTDLTLADGEDHVKCFTKCQSEFSLATLQKVLPPTKFNVLLTKRQSSEIIAAKVEGLVSCPFCYFSSVPPLGDKVFKCLNADCMKETCRQCKELNHVPFTCDEVKSDIAHHIIEEKMTEALLRTCYKCERRFYKEDGCNKMKCLCGATMCYICDKPVEDYKHFNPQGGENVHLCPLWSDDQRLNAAAVIEVAKAVKKGLLEKNPNLEINTDSLLPKLPKKTKGPHNDIANANQLPERVQRLSNIQLLNGESVTKVVAN